MKAAVSLRRRWQQNHEAQMKISFYKNFRSTICHQIFGHITAEVNVGYGRW